MLQAFFTLQIGWKDLTNSIIEVEAGYLIGYKSISYYG